jgi:hypothetical protein
VARFAPDAQELFDEWRAVLEIRVRGDTLASALESHLSKYRKLMPALALLFDVTRFALGLGDPAFVTLDDAKLAAAWCSYLESHAIRVFAPLVAPEVRAARELGEDLALFSGETVRTFAARDVYRNAWSGLTTPKLVEAGAETLIDLGWLRRVDDQGTGGRPNSFSVSLNNCFD